ncbi:MAG: PSD1 and planctomycete cytochrome C domain-containing protein [Planctomycetota bacterium]
MTCPRHTTRFLLLCAAILSHPASASAFQSPDFNRDIRPILAENCFYCHGQDAAKRQADLRFDLRESAVSRGAIVPGKTPGGTLLERIHSTDPDAVMPPPESGRHLSDRQKQLLHDWIAAGAEYQPHWAFTAPQRPATPAVENTAWPRHPIDHFVLAVLEKNGLQPAPEADRQTLIRRLSIDLIGLPPTPAEVLSFVNDPSPDAFDKLVDRLLASPHDSERMALPWLDAARYADSNGFQQDGDTWQWIWRDWLVSALNQDLPFDQFTIWQLAGDLLPDATREQKIASGFNRNHLLNGEGGAIPEEQRWVILFDRMETTSTTWLGLTLNCAQCHDHKYDPITARDYYSLLDGFNRVPESGTPQYFSSRIRVAAPFLELPSADDQKFVSDLEARIAAAEAAGESAGKQRDELKARLTAWRADKLPRVMIMSDAQPRQTHILSRGDYLTPADPVTFNTPAFLPPLPDDAPRNRLGFAHWLVSGTHPLTARVQVNRMWQHFFGAGLVRTSEDLGVQSEFPTHLDLLNWLAVEFPSLGWSSKAMHRLIVTSSTYRQSSRSTPTLTALDPENRLYARASRFRMPSLILRDWALASAQLLQPTIGGPPVYPYQPDGIWESLAITKERDFTYPASTGPDLYRRSLYTFWRRTVAPANLFDASNRQACRVRSQPTSTPLHALTTLNDPTWVESARMLAEHAWLAADSDPQRLENAFQRVNSRPLSGAETGRLLAGLQKQRELFAANPAAAPLLLEIGSAPRSPAIPPEEHAAWTAICLAILNLDESLTRE